MQAVFHFGLVYQIVDLRTVSFDVAPQEVLTKDSVTINVDAVVYYKVCLHLYIHPHPHTETGIEENTESHTHTHTHTQTYILNVL